MANTGWQRHLGTSKREQGIITPPDKRIKRCGCWYRGHELVEMCDIHKDGLDNILKNMQQLAKMQKAQEDMKKKESPAGILEEQTKK